MMGYIEIIKDHWVIFLAVLVIYKLLELLFKRLFGFVVKPLSVLKKVSILDWVLIAMILVCFGTIAYLVI